MAETIFEPDPKIAQIAAAYALDAVDVANKNFRTALDWSEASIQQVEKMLGILHNEMSRAKPPDSTVWTFAKAFGSYLGEVMRRHHGGEWGTVNLDGKSFPGLKLTSGALYWPWARTHSRLVNGPEDNVWHYYSVLIEKPA